MFWKGMGPTGNVEAPIIQTRHVVPTSTRKMHVCAHVYAYVLTQSSECQSSKMCYAMGYM